MLPPDDFDPPIGVPEILEAGLRRIVAPNPSPMTYRGTNTYLIGTHDLAVIDPGPDSPDHLRAILGAVGPDQHVSHILVTHTHLDHSPLARPLALRTGAPVIAFGNAQAGRSAVMTDLARNGLSGGGEGVDVDFRADQTVANGDIIAGSDWVLEVIHTPGHLGNHISPAWGDACLTADHVMGWASSLVSPPDGDLTDFMASCARLSERDWRVFYPGHGAPIHAPQTRLTWLIKHRLERETAILDVLRTGPQAASEIAKAVYTDTPSAMLPAATRNVLAHLIDLMGKSRVAALGPLGEHTRFRHL
ncbi:MAG: MBL fold metallo-hydrolase [Pseudomonadota bacterium]